MKIVDIVGKEILNSQGSKTIECEVYLEDGSIVNASVPIGTSKSKYEAFELNDNGNVSKACEKINTIIAPKFIGKEPNAIEMDIEMLKIDDSDNKVNLGANVILAVSMAIYRAHALVSEMELFDFISLVSGSEITAFPIPMINFINGGRHASNNLIIQEYLVIPYGTKSIKESIEKSIVFFNSLRDAIKASNKILCFGMEGGFASNFDNDVEPLDLITSTIASLNFGTDVFALGIDVAASQIYDEKSKLYDFHNAKKTSDEMIDWYRMLSNKYNLFSIEDGLAQDDWEGWIKLMNIGNKIHIVGDDIFATNPERISKGIEYCIANTVVIKPNQIGTITETLQAIALCKEYGLSTVVSHRSIETNDPFIVDLAVGANCTYIKCGGLHGGERISKYNRLLEIESELVGLTVPSS